jgi:hypothetical protein
MAKKTVKKESKKDPQQIIKTVMNAVLIGFILVSIGYAAMKSGFGKKEIKTLEVPVAIIATPAASQQAPAVEKGKVVLYYLHSTGRCRNCILMEQYAKEAVDKYFQEQVKSGKLEFKIFNVDEPQYSHYVQDYQLVTKSLVIALEKNGKEQKYENLKGIWQNVGNQEAYHRYVKTNVDNYLKEAN